MIGNLKMLKKIFVCLFVHISIIVGFLLCLFIEYYTTNFFSSALLLNLSIYVYVWICYSAHLIGYKYSHPYFLFLYAFLGFILWNNVTTFVGITNYWDGYFSLGEEYYRKEYVHNQTYVAVILSMLFFHLIAIVMGGEQKTFLSLKSISYSSNKIRFFQNNSYTLYWIFYPLYVIYILYLVYYVMTLGYMSLFGEDSFKPPLILGLADDCARTFFWIYVLTKPPKDKLRKVILSYGILLCLALLKGGRGAVFCEFLAFLPLFEYLGKEIPLKKIILIGSAILILSPIIFYIRLGQDISERDESILKAIVSQQGVSIATVSAAIVHENDLPRCNQVYLWGPLVEFKDYLFERLSGSNVQLTSPEKLPKLSQIMSFLVDRKAYYNGWGFGSSYIAEFYIFGGFIGVALLSLAFMGFLLRMFQERESFFILFFSFISIKAIVFSLRDNPFAIIVSSFFPIIIYFCFYLYYNICEHENINNHTCL
ncbi:O-antigen polysaccharide polymerase Wzy [Bacteroides fluxus]|uniref:O-antigen polysaccharide polymerase Wzy n=1 Tax=Bacteroides fluxus TaxID=626930 RepID=UPI00266CDD16|nr:O-antigen polysaccharide polymerase Wzy [Bacteroides fluxus]